MIIRRSNLLSKLLVLSPFTFTGTFAKTSKMHIILKLFFFNFFIVTHSPAIHDIDINTLYLLSLVDMSLKRDPFQLQFWVHYQLQ